MKPSRFVLALCWLLGLAGFAQAQPVIKPPPPINAGNTVLPNVSLAYSVSFSADQILPGLGGRVIINDKTLACTPERCTGSATVTSGGVARIRFEPSTATDFVGWQIPGADCGAGRTECTVTVNGPIMAKPILKGRAINIKIVIPPNGLTVKYYEGEYKPSFMGMGGGTPLGICTEGSCNVAWETGKRITFTTNESSDWMLKKWTGLCNGKTETHCTWTPTLNAGLATAPTLGHEVESRFAKVTVLLRCNNAECPLDLHVNINSVTSGTGSSGSLPPMPSTPNLFGGGNSSGDTNKPPSEIFCIKNPGKPFEPNPCYAMMKKGSSVWLRVFADEVKSFSPNVCSMQQLKDDAFTVPSCTFKPDKDMTITVNL